MEKLEYDNTKWIYRVDYDLLPQSTLQHYKLVLRGGSYKWSFGRWLFQLIRNLL
jgi:hypothetical protein